MRFVGLPVAVLAGRLLNSITIIIKCPIYLILNLTTMFNNLSFKFEIILTTKAIETVQRCPKPAQAFPGPKFSIGWIRYHAGNAYDFVSNIVAGKKPESDMYAGYKVQEVIEAAVISDREKRWVELPLKI